MFAEIALSNATRGFDHFYTYKIPDHFASGDFVNRVNIGSIVQVPFGNNNRPVEGVVMHTSEDASKAETKFKIKEILKVVEVIPLKEIQIDLVKWMRDEYICTYFDAARCMSPTYAVEGSKTIKVAYLAKGRDEIVKDIENLTINKLTYLNILECLIENDGIPVSELISSSGSNNSAVNTLVKKGYIFFKSIKYKSVVKKTEGLKGQEVQAFTPTQEQSAALLQINSAMKNEEFHEFLIHGVTGSGKTEIYLQLIDSLIISKKSAIILVPEISLTPLMIGRFEARYPGMTAVLHSRMTAAEKRESWNKIDSGQAMVVIGARSAVFAPVRNLGMVVIDEEHETTYKSELKPKYSAIEVARYLCKAHKAVLLLGSATPSVDTYYRALNTDMTLLTLKKRTNKIGMPDVTIVDMREELNQGNRSIFSDKLKMEIEKNLEAHMQTMLFLNRRGHSSFVICRECGFVVKCRDCSVSMTYHKGLNKLICHYCGRMEKNPDICPVCKSNKIRFFGTGTQKIEDELRQVFANATYIRMDFDTTSGKGTHEDILTRFSDESIDVMIGTQMITKGHDFESVTLVGVLAADSSLYSPDYRASERTFQQITQVSGRAGRGAHKGRVIIQTYNCDHPSIIAASKQNYEEFYNSEILLRKMLRYPPFCNIGCIIIHGLNETETKKIATETAEEIKKDAKINQIKELEIIGPAPSPSYRLRGRNRIRLILKHHDRKVLNDVLTRSVDHFYSKKHKDIDMSVDINPFNMV